MFRGILLLSIGASLFASSEYVPFSKFSKVQQEEYNFIKVEKKKIQRTKEKEVIINAEQINPIQIKKPISQNETKIKQENKEIVKNYKSKNILKDEVNFKDNSFTKDFSVTPKISYMHVSSSIEDENTEKTHEIVPELSFVYKNHTLKADYFNVNITENSSKFDTSWYRLAYLYKYYNANIGIGFNHYEDKILIPTAGIDIKTNENFPTIEVHIKNTQDQLVLEYGGFYGKNSDEIKSAYEYYLNLGYKIFNNDNLVLNLGYKNRTIDNGDYELTYKGPTLGISTTF